MNFMFLVVNFIEMVFLIVFGKMLLFEKLKQSLSLKEI